MPKLKQEIMAIADLYAEGLLGSAPDEEQQREVAEQLADLVAHMNRDPQFSRFMEAGTLDAASRRETLEKLFRGRMHDVLLNLLQVLNRRRRTELIRMILRCVELRLEEQREQREVTVYSAVPLWHELRSAIQRVMGFWLGKSVILIEEVRPELIGGVIMQVGDVRIDGSIRSRIDKLRLKLRAHVADTLHAETGKYVTGMES